MQYVIDRLMALIFPGRTRVVGFAARSGSNFYVMHGGQFVGDPRDGGQPFATRSGAEAFARILAARG